MRLLRVFAPPPYLRRAGRRAGQIQARAAAAWLNAATGLLWLLRAATGWPHAQPPALPPLTVYLEAAALIPLLFAALNLLGWLARPPTIKARL